MGLAADPKPPEPPPDFAGPTPPLPLVRWVGPAGGEAVSAELRICPLPMVTMDHAALFRLWPYWERGTMPDPGGLLDQPNGFVQAMDRIRSHLDAAAAEEHDKS